MSKTNKKASSPSDTKPGLTKDKMDAIKAGFGKKTEDPMKKVEESIKEAVGSAKETDAGVEKKVDEKPIEIMTDVTDSPKKEEESKKETKTIKIELDNVVEYKNKFYRGVQVVDKKLAEKLLELDKLKPINTGSASSAVVIEKVTEEDTEEPIEKSSK